MYEIVKTHKVNNLVRVIFSGCNTAIESFLVYIELTLFESSESLLSGIKNSNHLLHIIDGINSMFFLENAILVSFDIVNMFPNIDNKSTLNAVKFVSL